MAPAMKRKAVLQSKAAIEDIQEKLATKNDDMQAEEEISEEKALAMRKHLEKEEDKETVATREKELKAMSVDDLKKKMEVFGLKSGNKADMIKASLKHEAKERAALREKQEQIRAIAVQKKQELEAMPAGELKDLCNTMGIKGATSKTDRVAQVLAKWLQDDGVNKRMAKIAHDQRMSELEAMDKPSLLTLCDKACINPWVKDVLVERVVKREADMGKFLKPVVEPTKDNAPPKSEIKLDIVESLLASRKESEEAEKKEAAEADAAAKKIKEMKTKSVDELKKLATKRRLDVSGTKDNLISALYAHDVQEALVTSRKIDLKAMSKEELIQIVSARGLETNKSKDIMVETILGHEAKVRADSKAYDAKILEVAQLKKEELEHKTNAALKDMCQGKGLALGGSKEDLIARLVEAAQKDGQLDQSLAKRTREARCVALEAMNKDALVKLCEELDVDALVREVMIERIVTHEAESGEPAEKKTRRSAK